MLTPAGGCVWVKQPFSADVPNSGMGQVRLASQGTGGHRIRYVHIAGKLSGDKPGSFPAAYIEAIHACLLGRNLQLALSPYENHG